jgi:hypothetical protein
LQGVLITVCLFQVNINADIFHGWIVQNLLPKVPAGSVIVMDNANGMRFDRIFKRRNVFWSFFLLIRLT